jgi:hypothetical protein
MVNPRLLATFELKASLETAKKANKPTSVITLSHPFGHYFQLSVSGC